MAITAPSASAANPNSQIQQSEIQQTQGFRKAVTVDGVREHQAMFQAIADANGGTRVSGTSGYDQSAQYVFDRATAAGYEVSFQEFTFPFYRQLAPSAFERVSPDPETYTEGAAADYTPMTYSGSGDVTAATGHITATVGSLGPGCSSADFAGFTAGSVALIQRGGCSFAIKAANAQTAGASAVIIYNNIAGPLNGTLGAPNYTIPVIGTLQAIGLETIGLLASGPVTLHVKTTTESAIRTTRNVIAETPGGDPNRVVVVGAHLDSVIAGPGINDNGSGSGTILEIAETFAAQERETRNKVRFMWFAAEEFNLLGSQFYVNSLTPAQRAQIELMLNFDMVGSPNFVRFVYDGDNSAVPVGPGAAAGPPGSAEIERVFAHYFASQGLASEETAFSGRSDYGPFIAASVNIPAGGLFTGAEGIKTAAQAATYGGTAGMAYDPCYHQACDTFANNSYVGLDQMSDAAAHATLLFSKRNFEQEPVTTTSTAADATLRPVSVGGGGGAPAPEHDHDHAVDL
jgi:Zn-dependent M28 family amino/carboxypeptidase